MPLTRVAHFRHTFVLNCKSFIGSQCRCYRLHLVRVPSVGSYALAQELMEPSLFSSDFFHLEKAEQGVIQALGIAADTVEELAKGSGASQDILELHCKSFLETVQAVQQTLVALGPANSSNQPYQGRAYCSHLEASLLHQQVKIAEEQLQPEPQQQSAQQANLDTTQ